MTNVCCSSTLVAIGSDLQTLATRHAASTAVSSRQAEATNLLLQDVLQTVQRMSPEGIVDQRFDNYIQPAPVSFDTATTSKLPNTPLGSGNSPPTTPPGEILQRSSEERRFCSSECQCQCHSRTRIRTPQVLQQILGRLCAVYTGGCGLQSPCKASCVRRDPKIACMTFVFPKWILDRAISIAMFYAMRTGLTINIKTRAVVPEMSQLFALSRYDDVQGLQNLFSQRLASPDDIHVRGGWNALHFAVDHGCVDATRLLLDQGADPNWQDETGQRPIDVAWRNILHLRAAPQVSETFQVLFPGTEYLTERRFTRLHRLVLELETGDMDEELKTYPESIRTVDVDGWTPLHWAARRGQFTTLQLLLKRGGDPHIATGNEQRNALHLATQANSLPCLRLLLQHRRGNRVLDLEGKDIYGNSALRIAAGYNCTATAACLIEHGADLNSRDLFNEPALFSAVYENAHEVQRQLLVAGCDYTLRTSFGNTILHFAANESDLRTLAILTRARMAGVDVDAKNVEGFTAAELAARRTGTPTGFAPAFERLLASVAASPPDDLGSPASEVESWKSFEEAIWFESEQYAAEDILEEEKAAEKAESGETERQALQGRMEAEGVVARDTFYE